MYNFLYSVIIVNIVLWVCVLLVLLFVPPNTFINIFVFLFLAMLAIGVTASLSIFKFRTSKQQWSGPRLLFRKSLRWGIFVGFFVAGTLGFKAFDLINPLNYGLFMLINLGIYFWLRSIR
ncbi:hypothetical protein JXA34_03930 [Patescibacteria group bacterium]|nr:hypothetical protein [Patescibacteria group bacterium]